MATLKNNKPKKLVLDQSTLEEEFFEDVELIGLVSARKPYQLIWHIHRELGYPFVLDHEFEIIVDDQHYPVYYLQESIKQIEHFIFVNRMGQNTMLTEAKNIDFIWMIKGGLHEKDFIKNLINMLQSLTAVDYVFQVDIKNLKSKQLLII